MQALKALSSQRTPKALRAALECGGLTPLFENSVVKSTTTLRDTPSGSVDLVIIELAGQQFRLMSAGPLFRLTQAISFLVACSTKGEVDALWTPRDAPTS